MATPPRGWAKVKEAAQYAGVGKSTFEKWLKDGLKYVKTPTGIRLVKLVWIDEFLETFIVDDQDDIDNIVNEALDGLI